MSNKVEIESDLSAFKAANPESEHERLIMELDKKLTHSLLSFIEKNFDITNEINIEEILIVRDGVINFAGNTGRFLTKYVEQQEIFIRECKNIFNASISQEIKEK